MNKFAILSIVIALAAVASAHSVPSLSLEDDAAGEISELTIKPDDDGEVAYLAEEHKIFEDFCRAARDEVFTFIDNKKKEGVATIFAAFFGNINEITQELEKIQKAEAAKANESILKGEAEPVEGEEAQQSGGLLKSVGGALASYAKALAAATVEQVRVRAAYLKQNLNGETATEMVQQTCSQVQLSLQPRLTQLFKDTKAEIAASEPTKEVKEMLAKTNTLDKVGCITSGRVSKLVRACGFLSGGLSMLQG